MLCPVEEGIQGGQKGLSLLCECILHLRRDGIVLLPGDQPVLFKLDQAFGEHGQCNADHFSFELVVADHLFVGDIPEYGQFPLLAYDFHGIQDRAACIIYVLVFRQLAASVPEPAAGIYRNTGPYH